MKSALSRNINGPNLFDRFDLGGSHFLLAAFTFVHRAGDFHFLAIFADLFVKVFGDVVVFQEDGLGLAVLTGNFDSRLALVGLFQGAFSALGRAGNGFFFACIFSGKRI